jgi:hypothetical protein
MNKPRAGEYFSLILYLYTGGFFKGYPSTLGIVTDRKRTVRSQKLLMNPEGLFVIIYGSNN